MKYLLLIYANEAEQAQLAPEAFGAMMAEYDAFTTRIRESGAYLAGSALAPTPSATTVRVRGGKTLRTDGPFAETKEQLGGYYLVEAPDLDAACAIAAQIPDAQGGSIEVRPLMVFEP